MKMDKTRVRPGMLAVSIRGEKLGKVIRCDEETFLVEKGLFFPKDYQLRYQYITAVNGNEVVYALEEAGLRSEKEAALEAPREVSTAPAKVAAPAAQEEEVRMALLDEEIEVEKVPRETGHVRVHKEVKTEERHFTVPVTREEVLVEHFPASEASAIASSHPFEEQTVDIAVHEDEIRVTKRQVVREGLRVRKVAHAEQRAAAATVRHEEARIEDTTRGESRSPNPGPAGLAAPAGQYSPRRA